MPKLLVVHSVFVIELSWYFQEAPFDDVGKLLYLPVPSCHDWDTAKADKLIVDVKFLGSIAVSCRFTFEVPLLNVELPIVSVITFCISSFLNLINILEG